MKKRKMNKKASKAAEKKPIYSRGRLLVFGVVFAVIGVYFLWRALAVPPPPTIYLSPETRTLAINTTFTVQVRENSSTTSVNAVQANISYPASLVDFVSIDATGSAFPTEAQSSGGNGQVNIARGVIGDATGDQLVATITFRTKTTGGAANMAFTSGTALVSSTNNQDILPSLSATGGGTYTVDTVAPTVTITAPSNGSTIPKGNVSLISVSATDADAVTSVEFYIDGALVSTDTTSPYSYSWNTTNVSFGSHTIQARARDPSGNVGSSAIITVSVVDQTAPTTSITAPTSGSVLRGTVSITATATDNSGGTGISRVEFYVDSTLVNTDTSSPYSYSWNTATASNAAHSLTVRAYDGATPANVTNSEAVSVTVDNSAPTIAGNFRSTSTTLNSITLDWDTSTDNRGVTGYRLTRNGTTITTTSGSTLSYTDSGLSPGTSYSYTIVALDQAGNTSPAASLSASTQASTPGDLNGDGRVNITDLSILLSNYGTTNAVADINGDGVVNIFDLSILLSRWTG